MKKWIATLSTATLFLVACQTDDTEEGIEPEPTDEIDEETNGENGEDITDADDENGEESSEGTEDEPEETMDEEYALSQDLEAWIPKHENVVLEYEGGSFENAGFTITPQFVLEDTYQFANADTATITVEIYEYREDSVVRNFTRMETYFRENFIDTGYASEGDEGAILLQLPIEVGNTWESTSGSVYEITDSYVPIETNAGTFEAIEVTSTSEDGENVGRSYYAEGIGLVQRETNINDEELEPQVSTLYSIQEDEPENLTFSTYTLNTDATGHEQQVVELYLNTNDPARIALADVLRGNHDATEGSPVIDESVEINFMYLDEKDVAHIDFSEELITEMNAGSGAESLILQAIVNTIASYYRTPPVEEILLTVEGQPYTSGHITYEEGETIQIDDSVVDE